MTKTKMEAALEYLDRGWAVIPIKGDKRPAIKWADFQTRHPTEEEVVDWWTKWPDYDIAVITGEISGIVVVDCDNEEAVDAAQEAGMQSPIRVKTKRGLHLYFEHPKDGIRRGPRAGVNSRGSDWPKINGLDFRGDGSYALLPPSNNYEWTIPPYMDWDEMPMWRDWQPKLKEERLTADFTFSKLDLSSIDPIHPDEFISEWDRTAKYVLEHFPTTKKIPSGMSNGRNERVMRYISESILEGFYGPELRVRGFAFMNEFFEDNLDEREFEATVQSMEQAEKRNHPERFDDKGNYIYSRDLMPKKEEKKAKKLIQMRDAEQLLEEADAKTYLIEPWLPANTIVQVFGYSGHGKSLFVQHAVSALCAGRKYFGPFEIGRPARVLYLDFEMGMATIARRLMELRQMHGDTQDRLNIWTPFIEGREIDLQTREGLLDLQEWIKFAGPDVVVIDTIRSAYPGMAENSADEWAKVNKLAVTLRNSGLAVILIHHSNKPSESGVGREAGSTNQLTVLETQIRVAQVFKDEETAKQNAGLYDANYDMPVWPLLESKLPPEYRLYMVMEIRYGKVREWTDLHDRVQWIGYAAHNTTDEKIVVSSKSTKQRAKDMALEGHSAMAISDKLHRPLRLVRDWLELRDTSA